MTPKPETKEERPVQGTFEGFEVMFTSSSLKSTALVGPMAQKDLEPYTRVRITGEAYVLDVTHRGLKDVVGQMERIQILQPLPETFSIVEEL